MEGTNMIRRLREQRDADIVASYNEGESADDIASRHGISRSLVYSVLRAQGVETRPSEISRLQSSEMLDRRNRGETWAKIAKDSGVSISACITRVNRYLAKRALEDAP